MLRNTESSYGSAAKWLHWLIALWVLVAYVVILYLTGRTDQRPPPGLNYHKVIGFTILIPVLLRIVWRAMNPKPQLPPAMPRWQRWASHASHFLLYFLLLAMPITGYLGNGGGIDYGVFRIPPFASTRIMAWLEQTFGVTYAQLNEVFDTFHYGIVGPYVFWVLILAHAGAAIHHHVVQKDDVLTRMLPRRQPRGPRAYTREATYETLFAQGERSSMMAVNVSFEPGARTVWQNHPAGQYLIVTSGVGWVQQRGGPKREIREGDVVWTPPGVFHWHGATTESAMSHLAVWQLVNGSGGEVGEHVPDEVYLEPVK